MAINGGRLPEAYVLAHTKDAAIDWLASAEAVGVDLEEYEKIVPDTDKRNLAIEAAARLLYRDLGAKRSLPLTAKIGKKITKFYFRGMSKDECADIKSMAANPPRLTLEACRTCFRKAEDWGTWNGEPFADKDITAEHFPESVTEDLGFRVFAINQTTGEECDF